MMFKKAAKQKSKKTQNTPILKALSPSKSAFPSRSFTFPHLSPSESVFLQPSSSLDLLFFFHKFPPVYSPINFPLPSVSSTQPIHSFSHISHPHSFHWPNLPCLCLCPGCVCERVCMETLTCPSGTLSRATLCPSCCRCSRSCRRCTGSPGTGAWGWAGRWRARSSGCSSARWNGAAWRGWSICCLPPPAPASSRWNRESERERKRKRERESERDRMRGGGEREKGDVSAWLRGRTWKRRRTPRCRVNEKTVANEKLGSGGVNKGRAEGVKGLVKTFSCSMFLPQTPLFPLRRFCGINVMADISICEDLSCLVCTLQSELGWGQHVVPIQSIRWNRIVVC